VSLPIEKYSALLFDLDGTVAHSMPIHNKAWIEALGDKGPIITFDLLQEYAGISTMKTIDLFNKRFGWNFDPLEFTAKKEALFLKYLHEVKVVDPVFNIIQNYEKIPKAIVSGGPRENVQKMLTHLNLEKYFQFLVCAEDTERGKPYPDPFLKAAMELFVIPERCLVFEDGDAGIKAAKAAGMSVVKVEQDFRLTYFPK
jgi:HAD superfamily hydrolase (TIGR01509 family)